MSDCAVTESEIMKWLDRNWLDYIDEPEVFGVIPVDEWSYYAVPYIVDRFGLKGIGPDCRAFIKGIVDRFAESYRETMERSADRRCFL